MGNSHSCSSHDCPGERTRCFSFGNLVLWCGVLTGTSASLLDNNVVRELQSALKKGIETDDRASERESAIGVTSGT